MSLELILMAGSSPRDPVFWSLCNSGNGQVTQTGMAADLDDLAGADFGQPDRVVLVLPGTDVTVHRVSIPARSEAQARAALPYALEDDLAQDIDGIHAALGPQGEDGTRLALVIDRQRMADWLGALAKVGLSLDRMVPDYLAFPSSPDAVVIIAIDGRVVVTHGEREGFAASPDLLPLVLAPAVESWGATRIEACHAGAVLDEALATVPEGMVQPKAPEELPALFEAMHRRLARGGVDLLDGPYSRKKGWRFDLSKWRMAAALLGLLLLSDMALTASEGWRLEQKAETMNTQAETLFRETFPDVRRIVNMGAQLRTRLDDLHATSSGRYLELTSVLFNGLQAAEQARLEAIRFDGTQRELVADVSYGSYEDMEALKAAVQRGDVNLEEGAARQNGGRTLGEIRMKMP